MINRLPEVEQHHPIEDGDVLSYGSSGAVELKAGRLVHLHPRA